MVLILMGLGAACHDNLALSPNAAALEFQDRPRADDRSIRDRRDARGERIGYVTAGVDDILEIRLQRGALKVRPVSK